MLMLEKDLEHQIKKAVLANTITSFEVNISKDLVENDIILKVNNKLLSVSEKLKISFPCKFSSLVKSWCESVYNSSYKYNKKILDYTKYPQQIIDMYNRGELIKHIDYWSNSSVFQKTFIREEYYLMKNEDNDIIAFIVFRNLSTERLLEEEKQKKKLERYAYVDSVTGGDTYIKFKNDLRKIKKPGYIVSMDIHSFKIVNSVCGISKGDQVLRFVWASIKSTINQDDLAGHINADHFILYLNETSQEQIKRTLENITITLNFISADMDIPQLQAYFGVAHWNAQDKIELCYNQAVAAKHDIKDRKDINVSFFDQDTTDKLIFEKNIEDKFEAALLNKNFEIWYQPKYNPETNILVGAEALVRWRQANGEMMQPGLFIPIFEKNGMIRSLDEYVFKTVCEQQKKWLEEGIDIVPISINLSRASLYFKNVASQYKWITEKIGIDPNYVPIEITESAAVNNDDISAIVGNFYQAGFPLHMDDFGSGYSSLAALNTMHFDTLKLDKSLIDFIGNYSGDRLLEHTIALAKELGMHVTAEGVEKLNQVEFLQNLKCDSIQGFFFSKPLTVENFEKSLLVSCVIESFSREKNLDYYINKIKLPIESTSIYEFIVNLTQDKLLNIKGTSEWKKEVGSTNSRSYTAEYTFLAENMILPEYREAYLNFMNREYLIKSCFGKNEIRTIEYERIYKGQLTKMRLTIHLFKMHQSDDVWMYITVSNMAGKSNFDLNFSNFINKDPLTGVFNRQNTLEYAKKAIQSSSEKQIFIILDINDFKTTNRNLGYKFGDKVLIETSNKLIDFFPDALVGRIGSDKFLVLLSYSVFQEMNSSITDLISNLKKRTERVFYKKGKEVKITVSIGYSIFPDDSENLEKLILQAEDSLKKVN